jgi:bacterioferritin-associated ferredoxin
MEEVFVCRCEEVTREELEEAIRDGAVTMNELKRWTRAGMGLCQGKTCSKTVMAMLAQKTGKPLSEIKPATYRNPVRPMPIGCMTKGGQDDDARG